MMKGAKGKKIVVFLDYDGTLSPIVNDPDSAFMSDEVSTQFMLVNVENFSIHCHTQSFPLEYPSYIHVYIYEREKHQAECIRQLH